MNTYDIGNIAQLQATFVNINGVKTQPTAVTCYLKDPNGNITQPTPILNPSTGVYTVNVPLTVAGIWYYRFEGSGSLVAAADSGLQVSSSVFPS